jgi:hypothetical protein
MVKYVISAVISGKIINIDKHLSSFLLKTFVISATVQEIREPFYLFYFVSQIHWSFVNVKYCSVRRILRKIDRMANLLEGF